MEIDINTIVNGIDIEKVVREKIIDSSEFDDIISDIFDDKMKNIIKKKITEIITEYLSSESGKDYILEKFKDLIEDEDLLDCDEIKTALANFIIANMRTNLKYSREE